MKALYLDGRLDLRGDLPVPRPPAGEALVRVLAAGICNTDLELVKGYMGFRGVPGHEFVGVVEEGPDEALRGRRVVGEINCGCGTCRLCLQGDPRHCPGRTTLGIVNRDGAFAEYLALPAANLIPVPDGVPDEVAVFTEPVAAAFEILEQVHLPPGSRVTVLGDGKFGLLISQVLRLAGAEVLAVGRHEAKLGLLSDLGIPTRLASDWEPAEDQDVVVEVTGSEEGLGRALQAVRPRGTVVLKTTVAAATTLHMAPLVIKEITVVGSRCGPFRPALRALASGAVQVGPMVEGDYSLDRGLEAFEHAARRGTLKILLRP